MLEKLKFTIILLLVLFILCGQKGIAGSYDLKVIRETAIDSNNILPNSIQAFIVGEGYFPGWTVYKGCKEKEIYSAYTAFEIKYDTFSIIVDIPFNEGTFSNLKYGKKYNSSTFNALNNALINSQLIIFTHLHSDHITGLMGVSDYNKIKEKLIITSQQFSSKQINKSGIPKSMYQDIKSIKYEKYYKLSPGVVLIETPGHTPGHQSIFVKLKNGSEYLLLGDIAWNMKNIEYQLQRPLLVRFILKENKDQIKEQLAWLQDIMKNNTSINIVPSHDFEKINSCLSDSFTIYK